jgi:hypothetical protein
MGSPIFLLDLSSTLGLYLWKERVCLVSTYIGVVNCDCEHDILLLRTVSQSEIPKLRQQQAGALHSGCRIITYQVV